MKICIPVKENNGLNSNPYNHFGSAPFFLIYDIESEELKFIQNGDLNHEHGKCQPIKALSGQSVDVVLVGGIGAGAISKLNSDGIKVYKAFDGTILENVEKFKNNELMEISIEGCCNHHDGCSH